MWKIFIVYGDKSKVTLTGKQKDIDLRLALKYHNKYAAGRRCTATYQQYPVKKYPKMDLTEKIMLLSQEEAAKRRAQTV